MPLAQAMRVQPPCAKLKHQKFSSSQKAPRSSAPRTAAVQAPD
jgi:hypothetical protein